MVKMVNIRKEGNIISMDCYKEGDKENSFSLKVDAEDYHIVFTSLSEPSVYARQAASKIASLDKTEELPDEAYSIWC